MNSRKKILNAISRSKPELQQLPEIAIDAEYDYTVLAPQFLNILQTNGATAIWVEDIHTVKEDLQKDIANGKYTVNTIKALGKVNEEVDISSNVVDLATVEIAYIWGTLGVAENDSIWLDESQMKNRLLPFICQYLVIVLDVKKIVANMHEAYKQISIEKGGYGVFLAGPSKTADIEQSLVIGAHGARSLKVYLLG